MSNVLTCIGPQSPFFPAASFGRSSVVVPGVYTLAMDSKGSEAWLSRRHIDRKSFVSTESESAQSDKCNGAFVVSALNPARSGARI